MFKDPNLWNEFPVIFFFFFLERVPHLGKYFPADWISACELDTVFRIASLIICFSIEIFIYYDTVRTIVFC